MRNKQSPGGDCALCPQVAMWGGRCSCTGKATAPDPSMAKHPSKAPGLGMASEF